MTIDAIVVAEFAQLDRDGKLEDIKGMLSPDRADQQDRFFGEIAPYLPEIIAFCAGLGTITKGVTGTADVVALAKKLVIWLGSAREGAAVVPELGLRERLLVLLFEATTNRKEGLSEAKIRALLGCTGTEFTDAIAYLDGHGVARKTPWGDWKYARRRA